LAARNIAGVAVRTCSAGAISRTTAVSTRGRYQRFVNPRTLPAVGVRSTGAVDAPASDGPVGVGFVSSLLEAGFDAVELAPVRGVDDDVDIQG
jgi:hypothetical protein